MKDSLSPHLISLYKKHIPDYLSELLEYIRNRDIKAIGESAHKLYPIMGSMDDTESSELLKKLEKEDLSIAEIDLIADKLTNLIPASVENL